MSDALSRMKARIRREAAKMKKVRAKKGVQAICADFLDRMEDVVLNSKNEVDFNSGFTREQSRLQRHIETIDRGAHIEVKWSQEREEEGDWRDLRVLAVQVKWSDAYLAKNPHVDPQICIDVMRVFLEGISEEED